DADRPRTLVAELPPREFAEPRARSLIGAGGLVRVSFRELFRHRPDLGGDLKPMVWISKQPLHPGLGAVIRLELVLHQQAAENDPDPNVREGAKRQELLRRVDERTELGVLGLDLAHDRADRLVDEREPEVVLLRHGLRIRLARHASWAATTSTRRPKSRCRVCSGRPLAARTPSSTPTIEAKPTTAAARQRMLPYRCCRHAPAATVGRIASSDVASAST